MKILIPTEFSQMSKIAIKYAVELGKDIELEFVLLHVISTNTPAMVRLSSKKIEEAIKTSSEREMKELIKTITNESSQNPKISSKVIFGSSIENEVEAFALKNNIDMIFIGTKRVTGIEKIILGSNAAGIIENSSIPVLTIPENASYKGIDNIVYSSDLHNLVGELEFIIPFAKLLDSWVHILHVKKANEDFDEDLQTQVKRLKAAFSYQKIKFKEIKSISVVEGINQYVADVDADIVAMFTHHTTFIEKLLNKSVTQNTAYQTKTPLLSFQKNEVSKKPK